MGAGLPANRPVQAISESVDVLEQLDDLLHTRNALYHGSGRVGLLLGYQAEQIDDTVLGNHLDARAGHGIVSQHLGLDLGGQPGVVVAGVVVVGAA